jgi:hypothetical protein
VASITDSERAKLIKDLLAEKNKLPPQKHETISLPSLQRGEPLLCEVISIPVDEVLLNHKSHRLRSQLADDPEWQAVCNEPHSDAAQRVIARLVENARTRDEFVRLRESLDRQGQDEPGVITHEGVMINANTRVVAIRQLEDPTKRFIRAAVLPPTIQPPDVSLLELRLQMQRTLKADYSLTNELLFIEELSERGLADSFIAEELRYHPDQPKKAENEVRIRLRVLDLLRHMQRVATPPLRLSFFDDPSHPLGYQTLKDILPVYDKYMEQDPALADRYLEAVLLAVSVGVTSTHQLRVLDVDFVDRYVIPQLEDEDDELGVGSIVANLGRSDNKDTSGRPAGVDLLHGGGDDKVPDTDVTELINIVTGKDNSVRVAGPIPGSKMVLERDALQDALKAAFITGAKEKKRDDNEEDMRHAPREALRAATNQVAKAEEAVKKVAGTPDFDLQLQKALEAAYKKLKRSMRSLDATLNKSGVIGE